MADVMQYPDYETKTNEDNGGAHKQVSKTQAEKEKKKKQKATIAVEHVDIIKDEFWDAHPWILMNSRGRMAEE